MAKNFFDVNDRTLDPTEVHRKDKDERFDTAFNDDQKRVLIERGGSSAEDGTNNEY